MQRRRAESHLEEQENPVLERHPDGGTTDSKLLRNGSETKMLQRLETFTNSHNNSNCPADPMPRAEIGSAVHGNDDGGTEDGAFDCIAEPIAQDKSLLRVFELMRHPVWKVGEAALVLRCNEATVRRELNRGSIIGVRVGSEWRIPSDQFHDLVQARRPSGTPGSAVEKIGRDPGDLMRPAPPTSPVSPVPLRCLPAPTEPEHTLKLLLFGRPEIYIDGVRVVELERSDRFGQLIQLLALHRGGLSAESLAHLLTGRGNLCDDESLSIAYVRNLIWRSRRRASLASGWSTLIETSTEHGMGMHHYRLPRKTECDLWQFEDKLNEADTLTVRARAALTSSSPNDNAVREAIAPIAARAAVLREEALQLYRGELCEGSANGSIVQAARELEERYLRTCLQQGDYWRALAQAAPLATNGVESREPLLEPVTAHDEPEARALSSDPHYLGLWREALRNYERVLRVDNYAEEAHIGAMECLSHLGSGRGVDEAFIRCQDVLYTDLLQPPGEAVIRAYQHCRGRLRLVHPSPSHAAIPPFTTPAPS